MIDFHSHILPAVDDGSSSVEESLEMLGALREQGIDTVFATPHFYATNDSPEAFIKKRAEAYEKLCGAMPPNYPKILLGAEVMYFSGISRVKELSSLCLEGTKLILLEMPTSKWSDYTVNELVDLACAGNVTVMLAHVERYMAYQSAAVFERLCGEGILMQVNASFFIGRLTRRKALKMLKKGDIHALGSDCHNMTSRPPRLEQAIEIIADRCGNDVISELNSAQKSFFKNK